MLGGVFFCVDEQLIQELGCLLSCLCHPISQVPDDGRSELAEVSMNQFSTPKTRSFNCKCKKQLVLNLKKSYKRLALKINLKNFDHLRRGGQNGFARADKYNYKHCHYKWLAIAMAG